jgi:hypothetical protein
MSGPCSGPSSASARSARSIPSSSPSHEIRDGTHYDSLPEGDTADAIREHNRRLDAMIDFVDMVDALVEQFAGPEGPGLRAAASMLGGPADE